MEGPLLYDLHEIKEWDPVEEDVKIPSNFSLLNWVPGYAKKSNIKGLILPLWEIKISYDETRFVILSNSFAEVYSVPDKLLGRSNVFEEPMSRDIAWSRASDYFTIPSSSGKKFYLFDGFSAHVLYCVLSPSWCASTSLIFNGFLGSPPTSTWEDHLLAISDKGKAISFLIGKTGFQELSNFSLALKHVCAALYSKKYNLLIIAHWNSSEGLYVLGVWRALNEEPYFQKIETHTEGMDVHPILKMSLSICESKLVTLDSEGTLKVHAIPSLSLLFISVLEEQPLFDEMNPTLLTDPKLVSRKNDFLESSIKWHPYKVEWWDKDSVIISRYSGSVSIITVEAGKESRNLLGESVEFFSDIPSITPRFGKYIFCLERDYEEAPEPSLEKGSQRQGWFWGMSEMAKQKKLISTYRLIAMVKMTPEELYQRKIDKEEYGEALVLADVFHLDSDLVYLRRWHLSDYSVNALNDFLYKINNKSTITKECLDTVPNNIIDAKEVLQFGLKTIQSSKSDQDIDLENKFKLYISLLKTYERLIRCFARQEIKFNGQFFKKFRESTIEVSIKKFAQLGYWDAIRVMFEMHFEEISEDYIQLLSSFPESYSPLEYSFILPFANFKTKEVIYPFGGNPNKMSYEALCLWYKSRALTLEDATGLPDNSIDLLEFAKRHGVEVDEELLLDLNTLRTLIYDLKKGGLNYGIFKKMSSAEKVEEFILASSESGERVLISSRIQEYLLPFLENQEQMRKGSYNSILKEYFSRSRPRDVSFDKEIIFNLPERKIKDPNFISNCLDSLFKLNDNYEVLCEILQLFMEHSRMDILLEVNTIMNINVITEKYGYSKSMEIDSQDYKDEKYIDSVIQDLCRNVNFLQHIENPHLADKALVDVFTICKGSSRLRPSSVFRSTLGQLLQSENRRVVSLLVESLECKNPSCRDCFLHRSASAHVDLPVPSETEREELLLSTAEFYLRTSHFIGDHAVSLAELCLSSFPNSSSELRVKTMRNALRVAYLLHDFGLPYAPSRLLDDLSLRQKTTIIRDILLKNKSNYRRTTDILLIASLLSPEESFTREVELMIARHSLDAGDVRCSLALVKSLIAKSHQPAGDISFEILQIAPHLSMEDRETLNSFCLTFGRPEHVLELLDECKRRKESLEPRSPSKEDASVSYDSSVFVLHPFYDPRPRLHEVTSLWTLSCRSLHPTNVDTWISHLLNYDILAGVSLLTSLDGNAHYNEDRDEKNYLFIKAYVASIQGFSKDLRKDTVLIPPKTLIGAAVHESSTENTSKHPIHPVMARFNAYIEARRLLDLDANIDVVRFVNDEAYKRDTILGLSMSSDVHSFNLAMKYSQDNESIHSWDLCLNFLRCVFAESPSKLQSVLQNNPKVVKTLLKDPEKLEKSLKKYIYQSLSGKEPEDFLNYYRLLQALTLLPESQVKLLKKLLAKSMSLSSAGIDFKDLLGDSQSQLSASLKRLTDSCSLSEVLALVEVLSQINPLANKGLIYQSLCEKYFETGMSKGLSIEQIFEQCEEHLRKMSGSQLKEFVVSVSFKSRNISLTFTQREAFFTRLRDLLDDEDHLLSDLESWIAFNQKLSFLPDPTTSDLLFELGGTLGDDGECRAVLRRRLAEGRSTLKSLLPVLQTLSPCSKEDLLKEALVEVLETSDEEALRSLCADVEDLITDEEEIQSINDMLIRWCMSGSEASGKAFVMDFVRRKSKDKEALSVVDLHRSRSILSKAFQGANVEELLPSLSQKASFLSRVMTEDKLVGSSSQASALLDLLCFWEESEGSNFIREWKRGLLELAIRRNIAQGFTSKLEMFALEESYDLEGLLRTCYEAKEISFALLLLDHCASFREDMRVAKELLERKYPLTLQPSKEKDPSDFPLPFSLWMTRRMK